MDPPYYGTDKFFFLEDNTCVGQTAITDGNYGGRFVCRSNDFTDCRPGWHGTEGNGRGVRVAEIYGNAFHFDIAYNASNRSGTCFYHDNTFDGVKPSNNQHSTLQSFRTNGGVGRLQDSGISFGII